MFAKYTLNYGIKLCILLSLICSLSHAQKNDSTSIYEKIRRAAYKHKFTTWVYHTIFVEPKPIEYPSEPASKQEKIVNPYLKYEGYTIRNINVTVFDPFGYSVIDTVPKKINSLQKLSNRAHITTRHWVIINKLLFEKNDTIGALELSESERLLRQSVYISDAHIFLTAIKNTDSVDVNVIVQDKWSITAPILITDVSGNIRFRNENLFGVGQQFEQYTGFKRPDIMDYSGFYNISNIDNTYISAKLSYQSSNNGTGVGLAFERPFYSPLSKWAGGVGLNHTQLFYKYTDTLDGGAKSVNFTNYSYDIWAGKAIKLNDTKSFFSQSNNLIIGCRYYNTTYIKRPFIANEALQYNANTSAYIGNIGFAVQQYYKDKFIYRFGANEDVPEGLIFQLLYGADKKELKHTRYYAGIEIARAKHFTFGYLTSTFSHSIFFNKHIGNDITSNYRLYYFSDLLRLGKWYLREFVNCDLTYGMNKQPEDKITLSASELYGFNSGTLEGTKKMVANIETVAYAPYNIIGFKLAPVLLVGFGMMGDKKNALLKSNLYQAYSLGLMVRNENLLSSTFQISVGFYPFLPNRENYLVTYNPVASFTLRVRAFSFSKPAFISY